MHLKYFTFCNIKEEYGGFHPFFLGYPSCFTFLILRRGDELKFSVGIFPRIYRFLVIQNKVEHISGSVVQVRILSTLNRELLKPSASVALHRHSNALVDVLPPEADSSISLLSQSEKPDVTYQVSPLSLVLVAFFHFVFVGKSVFGRFENCLVCNV